MRVLELLPHTAAVDGIQRASLDLTRALTSRGDEVIVLTMQRGDNFDAWWHAAAEVRVLPSLAATWRQPRRLARALRASRPRRPIEAVVTHRLDMLTAGALIAWRAHAPLILHAHNAPPPWFRWGDIVRAPGSLRTVGVIVASRYMESVWRTRVAPSVPLRVVEYPIDPSFFQLPGAADRMVHKRSLGLAVERQTVGFFGRLDPAKGVHVLAEALAILARERGSAPQLIIQGTAGLGAGVAGEAYTRRCRELLGDGATWVPPGPDTRRAMAASDVIAVPSVWQEPSGLVVSEALCMGIPVVASSVGGIPEQLPSRSSWARTAPPGDAGALAVALGDLLRNPPSEPERAALRAHVLARRLPSTVGAAYRSALLAPRQRRAPDAA